MPAARRSEQPLRGATALADRRNRALAWTGAFFALLLSGFLLLVPVGICFELLGRGTAAPPLKEELGLAWCVSPVSAILAAGFGVMGAIPTLILLNKPEVIQSFQRPR